MQIDLAQYSSPQLSNYLSDVTSIDGKDLESLEALSEQFPYCQIIQSLIAKASISTSYYEEKLEKAAISAPARSVLFSLIHHPELFENKIDQALDNHPEENTKVAFADEDLSKEIDNNLQETNDVAFADEELSEENVNHQQENNNVAFADENLSDQENVGHELRATGNQIVSQDKTEIHNILPLIDNSQPSELEFSVETYDHHDSVLIKEIEEEAISASIKINSEVSPQPAAHNSQHSAEPTLYNDDSLPFSFLWWLNKTRKEHYENSQPYKTSDVSKGQWSTEKEQLQTITQSQQLNHQITESALALSVLDAYKNDEPQSLPVTKEDHIIKQFITKEPHIKPLAADKIDTENKAKKSSADSSELVSETLAKIYVEQMLYAKALDTYKKLSLKYPEKSTYFASQIKYLELKVN